MARVPGRTRIAIVGYDDLVTEIVNFDHTRELVRDCKKMVDVSGHPEVEVGWRLRDGGIERPPFDQSPQGKEGGS